MVAESIVACNPGWSDEDHGDTLWFTGQGKKKDQELIRGNAALANACNKKAPIRVIRGHQLRSSTSPHRGYRYDGLYRITTYEQRTHEGRRIWKFLLERLEGQPAAPYQGMKNKYIYSFSPTITLDLPQNYTRSEISEWIASGVCPYCGSRSLKSLPPSGVQKHFGDHLHLAKCYLPRPSMIEVPPTTTDTTIPTAASEEAVPPWSLGIASYSQDPGVLSPCTDTMCADNNSEESVDSETHITEDSEIHSLISTLVELINP
ncbi:SAD/SRA domain [Pelomyxa schiedti]|nr:SAD/SRA domain [Pelomyxa schiedti]